MPSSTPPARTVLIAGCGDLGTEVGLRFASRGARVTGLRRSAEVLPVAIEGQSVDLSRDRPSVPADTDIVIVAIAPGQPSLDAYRAAYVEGLRNLLDAVDASNAHPRRFLLVSSTAVYDVCDGSWVDETTPAEPTEGTAAVLREAEKMLRSRVPDAIIFRLAGIYGPGRERLITQVRAGRATVSRASRYTNRIHRDDAAAAVVHLVGLEQPAPIYLGVDDAQVASAEVLNFVASELGLPAPVIEDSGSDRGGNKRCNNALLRSSGFQFRYPDYRSGYRALLAGEGTRHP